MTTNRTIDPAEALNGFFRVVREEALNNPRFASRLLDAVGYTVEFRGDEALAAVDPMLVAMRGPEEFRRTFLSMTAAKLKKIGKDFSLVESHETARKSVAQLVDLLWERASERLHDLMPPTREAAE
jgi:uncharacterized protein YbcC (UPF0753/DUF2309 family)